VSEDREIKRENCTRSSKKYTWRNVAKQFLSTLVLTKKAKSCDTKESIA